MNRREYNRLLRFLLSRTHEERMKLLAEMDDAQRREFRHVWRIHARTAQVAPPGGWRTWLIMAGRGFGKTRAGAEWVRELAEADPQVRIALVSATLGEARAVMVEGESGILAISPPGRVPAFEPSLRRLTWPNGAEATLYSAGEPESLRGPQHHHAWCDEVAKWDNAADRATRAWDNLQFGLRLGELPRCLATTTPRAVVKTPTHPGKWRVRDWEWHDQGIDLNLIRLPAGEASTGLGADPGRVSSSPDLAGAPTQLAALELPWDGTAARMPPQILAVASSTSSGWSGAALYVDQGDGALQPLGPSGRGRGLIGTAQTVLAPASPLLFDRHGQVTVALAAPDLSLADATMRQLAMGANRALLGKELIQFLRAEPTGSGTWRLSGLWRGRGGTESAIASHQTGERFVLLDGSGVILDHNAVGTVPGTTIAALGLGDAIPATSPVALCGIGYRPLAPVHGRALLLPNGALRLTWVRRARGAWLWDDGVETPLNEQSEGWTVAYGEPGGPVASWQTATAELSLSAPDLAELLAAAPGGAFRISQRGDRGVSEPLAITLI